MYFLSIRTNVTYHPFQRVSHNIARILLSPWCLPMFLSLLRILFTLPLGSFQFVIFSLQIINCLRYSYICLFIAHNLFTIQSLLFIHCLLFIHLLFVYSFNTDTVSPRFNEVHVLSPVYWLHGLSWHTVNVPLQFSSDHVDLYRQMFISNYLSIAIWGSDFITILFCSQMHSNLSSRTRLWVCYQWWRNFTVILICCYDLLM